MHTNQSTHDGRSTDQRQAPKAVIYLRARVAAPSNAKQAEDRAIAAQRKRCLAHATWLGAQVVQEFTDAGASAGDLQRPGLVALCERLKVNDLDYVIVVAPDRLARSHQDYRFIEQAIASGGADLLIAHSEDLRPADSTAASAFVTQLTTLMAEMYSHQHALDTRRGLARARRRQLSH